MWSAHSRGERKYYEVKVKYWGVKPIGYFRYQVPTLESVEKN